MVAYITWNECNLSWMMNMMKLPFFFLLLLYLLSSLFNRWYSRLFLLYTQTMLRLLFSSHLHSLKVSNLKWIPRWKLRFVFAHIYLDCLQEEKFANYFSSRKLKDEYDKFSIYSDGSDPFAQIILVWICKLDIF